MLSAVDSSAEPDDLLRSVDVAPMFGCWFFMQSKGLQVPSDVTASPEASVL
jgi:hypothetical protein